MGDKTGISWTDSTWNPATGCSKISAGCKNCYAEKMAKRLKAMGQANYKNGFAVACHPHMLDQPERWKRPRNIFVCSMGDLFHEDVPSAFIQDVYDIMESNPHHRFQVLTKRPERMEEFLSYFTDRDPVDRSDWDWMSTMSHILHGVSVEDESNIGRVDVLRKCRSVQKFVSFEPLVGSVKGVNLTGVDWAIVGGESGAGARPCNLGWFHEVLSECRTTGTKFFMKQLGADNAYHLGLVSRKCDKFEEWPNDFGDILNPLKVREIP